MGTRVDPEFSSGAVSRGDGSGASSTGVSDASASAIGVADASPTGGTPTGSPGSPTPPVPPHWPNVPDPAHSPMAVLSGSVEAGVARSGRNDWSSGAFALAVFMVGALTLGLRPSRLRPVDEVGGFSRGFFALSARPG
jgi:hypothetical protein